MGAFDDLIPTAESATGAFADLIPESASARGAFADLLPDVPPASPDFNTQVAWTQAKFPQLSKPEAIRTVAERLRREIPQNPTAFDAFKGTVGELPGEAAKSVIKTGLTSPLRFVSRVGQQFTGDETKIGPQAHEAAPLERIANAVDASAEVAYPSPDQPGLEHAVAQGVGQVATMLGGGAALKALGAGTGLTATGIAAAGGVAEFDDAFERAIARGDDADTAFAKSLGYATVSSLIENRLGAGRLWRQMMPSAEVAAQKLTALGVSRAVGANILAGGLEEGSQRSAQNLIIEGKPSMEGVMEEAIPGAIIEGTMGLPASVGNRVQQWQQFNAEQKLLEDSANRQALEASIPQGAGVVPPPARGAFDDLIPQQPASEAQPPKPETVDQPSRPPEAVVPPAPAGASESATFADGTHDPVQTAINKMRQTAQQTQVRKELEALPGAEQDLTEGRGVKGEGRTVAALTSEQTDAGLREDNAPATKADLAALAAFIQNGGPNPFAAKPTTEARSTQSKAANESNIQAAAPNTAAGTGQEVAQTQVLPQTPQANVDSSTQQLAPNKPTFSVGQKVAVRLSNRSNKEHLARITQLQPDGSAQVQVDGEKTFRMVSANQLMLTKTDAARAAKADELTAVPAEQQAKVKADAAEFAQLVEDYAPQLDWAPGEAYDRNTVMQEQGVTNARLRAAAEQTAMRKVLPGGQANSIVDRAKALPLLEAYLKQQFPGDNSIAKRRTLEEFGRSETNPEQAATVERDQATLEQLAASRPNKPEFRGLKAVGRSVSRGQRAVRERGAGSGVLSSAGASTVTELERIFGVRIIFVENARFNGVRINGTNLVLINAKSPRATLAIAGHELMHHIKAIHPGLYADFVAQARTLLRNSEQFRSQLAAKGYPNITEALVEEEMFADVLGDAVLDPVFLQQLAKSEPNLFKRFARTAVKWLEKLIAKAKALGGFESAQYVTDLTEMRERLLNLLRDAGRQTQFERAGIQQEETENTEQGQDAFSKPEKPLLELTRDQFDRKYSIHFDVRDGAADRVESIMRDGLRSGMVSSDIDNRTPEDIYAKHAMARGWARFASVDKPGAIAYVIRNGDLRGNTIYVKPGTKPVAVVRLTKENQSVYEALQEQGGDRFSMEGGDLFGAPESVEEQRSRLKAEKLKADTLKAKEAMQERAGARLIGKDLDTTQEMFGAEVKRDKSGQGDMFSLPKPEDQSSKRPERERSAIAVKTELDEAESQLRELTRAASNLDLRKGKTKAEHRQELSLATARYSTLRDELLHHPEYVAEQIAKQHAAITEANEMLKPHGLSVHPEAFPNAGRLHEALTPEQFARFKQLQNEIETAYAEIARMPKKMVARVQSEMESDGRLPKPKPMVVDAGRSLEKVTDWLRSKDIASPGKSLAQRLNLGARFADTVQNAKTSLQKARITARGVWKAAVESYKAPPKDDDFRHVIKSWIYADQRTGLATHQFVKELVAKVPTTERRKGISVWLDAGGDTGLLRAQMMQVPEAYRGAWRAALNLTPDEQSLALKIKQDFADKLDDGVKVGLIDQGREDYGVPQRWKIKPEVGNDQQASKDGRKGTPGRIEAKLDARSPFFSFQREVPSYFDGVMAGGVPENLDIAHLVATYDAAFHKSLSSRGMIAALQEAKAKDGLPIVKISGSASTANNADGKAYFVDSKAWSKSDVSEDGRPYRSLDHSALKGWKLAFKDADGNPIIVKGDMLIHPDHFAYLKNELGQSALREVPVIRGFMQSQAFLKASKLSASFFHLVTIGEHMASHLVNPFLNGFKIDLRNGDQQLLVRNGLELGMSYPQMAYEEGLASAHSGLFNKIPGLGDASAKITDWMFKDYIPAIMMKAGLHALENNRKRYGDKLTPDQVAELTAMQMNAAGGLLNYRLRGAEGNMWGRLGANKTWMDIQRLALLAPQFLEARARVVGQALKPYGMEQRKMLIMQAGILFIGARILNKLLDDDPHWLDNPFSVVYKGRAYSIRTIVGDFWHLQTDPNSFAAGRLSPLGRVAIEDVVMNGRDLRTGARKETPIETHSPIGRFAQNLVVDIANWLTPITVEGMLPGSTGREQTLTSMALSSLGVGSRKYTALGQVYDMAAEFNRRSDDPKTRNYQANKEGGTFPASDYRKLDALLDAGETEKARREIKALVADGKSEEQIKRRYSRHVNFTGSAEREKLFLESLSDREKKIYDAAIKEREARATALEKALSQ